MEKKDIIVCPICKPPMPLRSYLPMIDRIAYAVKKRQQKRIDEAFREEVE